MYILFTFTFPGAASAYLGAASAYLGAANAYQGAASAYLSESGAGAGFGLSLAKLPVNAMHASSTY